MNDLLSTLWRGQDLVGDVTFWFTGGEWNKRSYHVPLADVLSMTAADEAELGELAPGSNVYYGLGLRRPGLAAHQQGGKKDIIALPAIPLDIDFYNPKAHKATNLPKDIDEAAEVLLAGEHYPSIVVGTGNGAHLYWLLDKVMLLNTAAEREAAQRAIKTFQARIRARGEAVGWQLDDTSTVQRVWRVPGYVNQKTQNPVELWHLGETRYSLGDLGVVAKTASSLEASTTTAKTATTKTEPADLTAATQQLKAIPPDREWSKAIKLMLAGESFATPGNRDHALQALCSVVAWLPAGRKADPDQLAELFRPSLAVWANEERDDGKEHVLEDDLFNAADKIRRSQEDYWHQQEKLRPQYEGMARALGVSLDAPAEDDDGSTDYFKQRSIIQYRGGYYCFDYTTNTYSNLRVATELVPWVRDAWVNAPKDVSLYYINSKGQEKAKKLPQLSEEYVTVAHSVICNLHETQSRFDPTTGIFHEAIGRRRVTEPQFDESIDQWLKLLAKEHYDKLCDWLATVTKLDEPNSCLYLGGTSGAGKSMLAQGLARLWTDGPPTKFESAVADHNDELVLCPLVWIDEGLSGHRHLTEQVRILVSQHSFSLNEKYLPPRRVKGAIRLIICANNDEVLSDPSLSSDDEEAIVKRILYIFAHREAERFIVAHGGKKITDRWVEGGGIARHVLWLAKNREVAHGDRFLVEGGSTEMHRKMLITGDANGMVYEWITKFASNPKAAQQRWQGERKPELARIGQGKILVNTEGMLDCWDVYMSNIDKPPSGRAGRVIKKVSDGRARLGARSSRYWFHQIVPEMILSWSESNQIGNQDRIEENLKGELDES